MVFHHLTFPSVFRLFQFLEVIEFTKQPYICDFRLIQREMRQDKALVALLESGLTFEQAKQKWHEQQGLTKQESYDEDEGFIDIGDVGGSHRGSNGKESEKDKLLLRDTVINSYFKAMINQIKDQLTKTVDDIKVLCITWNMARKVQTINFRDLIPNPNGNDLVVLSFQEGKKITEFVKKMDQHMLTMGF